MAAGSIIIDLLMKTGSFETDTKRAEKALADLKLRAEEVGATIGGAIVAGAGAAILAFKSLASAAGEFKDIEERVGASAESLASLSIAAHIAGLSVDEIAGSMNKLTKNLTGVDDESKAAGAALSALGIPIEEFKRLDPVQQIDALQKAFAGFADGSQKTAVALALFGKQGAATLNLFKALEDTGGRQVILTQEQITLADDYSDKQAKLNATIKAYAESAATDVLPAMNELTSAAKELIAEFVGIDAAGKKLAGESPIKAFADESVAVLAFIIDAGQGVSRVFEVIGKAIAESVAVLNAVARRDFAQVKDIIAEFNADIDKTLNAELFSARLERLRAAAIAARLPDPNQSDAESRRLAAKPQLDFQGAIPKDKKTKEVAQTEAERYLETLQKQVERIDKLSEQEKALADIEAKRLKGITPALEVEILMTAQLVDYTKRLKELRDGEVQTNTNIGKAQAVELDALLKSNDATQKEIDLLGKTNEELAAYELQQVRVTRAEKEATLAKKEAQGVDETQLQSLQAEIDALTKREELLNEKATKTIDVNAEALAAKAGQNTKDVLGQSIEEGILTGFRNGSKFIDVFINELKAQFAKTILRPLIQPAVDSSNQALGDIFGALGGLFGGSGSGIVSGGSGESITGEQIRGRHAMGGTEHAGGAYLVGERGPEIFRPSTSGQVIPNSALTAARPVAVTIENNGQPVRATSTTQETDAGTLVKIALEAVGADIAGGNGPVTRGLKARGVNVNGNLPRRA